MNTIRSNTLDTTTSAALWTNFHNFHNEVNDYDTYFSSLSAACAFKMQRTLFSQGLQPYVVREAMLSSVTSLISIIIVYATYCINI